MARIGAKMAYCGGGKRDESNGSSKNFITDIVIILIYYCMV